MVEVESQNVCRSVGENAVLVFLDAFNNGHFLAFQEFLQFIDRVREETIAGDNALDLRVLCFTIRTLLVPSMKCSPNAFSASLVEFATIRMLESFC